MGPLFICIFEETTCNMSEVNFYLKTPQKNGKSSIYLQFKYSGRRLKFYFDQNVEPKNWNSGKQHARGKH